MGFVRLAPKVVRHSDGYTVQIGGRYHIEYLEEGKAARVVADLEGPRVLLHAGSVEWTLPELSVPTDDDSTMILDRVCAGLAAMGDTFELVEP